MKILVPAVASGAIIGKGGETIASLQKDSGARVKMSKSHDFYPGNMLVSQFNFNTIHTLSLSLCRNYRACLPHYRLRGWHYVGYGLYYG